MSVRQAPIANPRPLAGAIGLVCFALAAVAIGHQSHARAQPPASSVVATRSLVFKDRSDGAVLVYDSGPTSASEERLAAVIQGQSGFLRGVLRGFARGRKAIGIGDDPPFRLTAWADGQVTLYDPSTGRSAELEAFGPDNERVFTNFLPQRPQDP